MFLSLFLNSCSPSNAPGISAFAPTNPSLSNFSPDENIFLECAAIKDKVERYGCYKDAALYAMQQGATVEQLFLYANEGSTQYSP